MGKRLNTVSLLPINAITVASVQGIAHMALFPRQEMRLSNMPIPGYVGNILYVDLTGSGIKEEPLDPGLAKTLIGGYGINNKLAYDLIPPMVDPLSSQNSIILGAGPFAGTFVPGAAKLLATTKFPVNGAFATAAGGGSFAIMLKSAGYDHVIISGAFL